jgi:hypothetical protein
MGRDAMTAKVVNKRGAGGYRVFQRERWRPQMGAELGRCGLLSHIKLEEGSVTPIS